jgi:imidazolonepropionase-like amidohydrolase
MALVGANLIDGASVAAIPDAVVIVENGRISAVGQRSQLSIPPAAERIELTGLTQMGEAGSAFTRV